MSRKIINKIIFLIIITIILFGFVCPALISYPDDILVIIGFGIVLGWLYYLVNTSINLYKQITKE